ncbi:hypothetical protein BV898_16156 [Hypsibius exemplaris]|uniref:Uncharacterized protein n=1 Tax=Hypsibius exemplaris TaxID=2072580 RepID=A0A9X6NFB1_HYPEX|nr:hypothetical protein BV898_16156 [Hypsibius exemplaris]
MTTTEGLETQTVMKTEAVDTGESNRDKELTKVGTALSQRKFIPRNAIVQLDGGPFLKDETLPKASANPANGLSDVPLAPPNTLTSPAVPAMLVTKLDEHILGETLMTSISPSLRLTNNTVTLTQTGPMEDPFLTNEDLSEEDRNKAIAWAAAAQGVQHIGFLPECVLKTGFRIKKYGLWMPMEMCVDYQHQRLTLMCPDSISDVLLRRMVAHRIEVGDVRVETPISHKYKPGSRESAASVNSHGVSVPHFSKRRVKMARTDGLGKYRLIAPSTEYRDRLLDILYMMNGPTEISASSDF